VKLNFIGDIAPVAPITQQVHELLQACSVAVQRWRPLRGRSWKAPA